MLHLIVIIIQIFVTIGIVTSQLDGCTLVLFICLFLQKKQTEALLLCCQSMVPASLKVSSVLALFVIL